MKNCRKKFRKLTNWTDSQFASALGGKKPKNIIRNSGKTAKSSLDSDIFFYEYSEIDSKTEQNFVVTESDMMHAMKVLGEFCEMEPKFIKFLQDDNNWQIEGEDENGKKAYSVVIRTASLEEECCG